MQTKILSCITALLLAFGSLTSYADSGSLDQTTIDRLRETYNLEVPNHQSTPPSTWSQGDWGVSLDPASLPDLILVPLLPVLFLTRQLVFFLSN